VPVDSKHVAFMLEEPLADGVYVRRKHYFLIKHGDIPIRRPRPPPNDIGARGKTTSLGANIIRGIWEGILPGRSRR